MCVVEVEHRVVIGFHFCVHILLALQGNDA